MILIDGPEGSAHLVHGRPQDVGTQAQQQLEDTLVRAWADIVDVGVHLGAGPGLQPPVFVVDEYSAEANRRLLRRKVVGSREVELVVMSGNDIGPPHPRRHTDEARQMEHTVGRAAGRAASYDQGAGDAVADVLDILQGVGLPLPLDGRAVHFSAIRELVDDGRLTERADDDGVAQCCCRWLHFWLAPGDEADVGCQGLGRHTHHGMVVGGIRHDVGHDGATHDGEPFAHGERLQVVDVGLLGCLQGGQCCCIALSSSVLIVERCLGCSDGFVRGPHQQLRLLYLGLQLIIDGGQRSRRLLEG